MKHTKKIIAILICLAMLPWTMIPVFAGEADSSLSEREIYSAVFDNSGDENENLDNWTMANTTTDWADDGALKIVQPGGWGGNIKPKALPAAETFKLKLVFRYFVVPTAVATEVAILNSAKQPAAFRVWDQNNGGGANFNYWGADATATNASTKIPLNVIEAIQNGEWTTITLDVKNGVAETLSIEIDSAEVEGVSFTNVARRAELTGINLKNISFRFNQSSIMIKELSVVTSAPPTPPTIDADDVLYSMTFDKSGDESERLADWNFNASSTLTEDGYFAAASNGWTKIAYSGNAIEAATTFTTQVTYRYRSGSAATTAFSLGIGAKEFGWRLQSCNHGTDPVYSGTSDMGQFGVDNKGGVISADVVSAWSVGEWVTVTLEVVNGAPTTVTFDVGDVSQTLEYQNYGSISGLTASTPWFYINFATIEIYDYRIIKGADLDITEKNDSKIEMVGLQKHANGTDVRFVAKLKDIDVENVKFEIKAVKSNATEMVAGKCYVTEAITKGYTSVVNGSDSLTAADGELYVVFVLYGLDLDTYDYDFTVSAIAGSVQSMAHTYTVK